MFPRSLEATEGRSSRASGFKGRLRSYVVYRGDSELDVDGTRVLPLDLFLRRLHDGDIVG